MLIASLHPMLGALSCAAARDDRETSRAQPRDRVRHAGSGDDIDDGTLVDRALGGDVWAEEALYRRHVQAVAGLAARLLGGRDGVEDVVQDAFVIVFEDLTKLRDGSAFRPWLLQIAVRQVHRRFRRRRVARMLGIDRDRPGSQDDPRGVGLASMAVVDASQETRAELASLDRVLAKQPHAERIAWCLRHVEAYALAEVAELSDCSLATAKRRIHRVEQAIARHVAGGNPEDRLKSRLAAGEADG